MAPTERLSGGPATPLKGKLLGGFGTAPGRASALFHCHKTLFAPAEEAYSDQKLLELTLGTDVERTALAPESPTGSDSSMQKTSVMRTRPMDGPGIVPFFSCRHLSNANSLEQS